MPKQRITKEMVVAAAFEIAREQGMEQVLVKNIADKIGCSVQPIFLNRPEHLLRYRLLLFRLLQFFPGIRQLLHPFQLIRCILQPKVSW